MIDLKALGPHVRERRGEGGKEGERERRLKGQYVIIIINIIVEFIIRGVY